MSTQSLVLRRCASTSSSGLPANSSFKYDQFNCGMGAGWIGCAGGAGGCTGEAGGVTGSITGVGWGENGLPSAMIYYNLNCTPSESFNYF